MISLLLLKNSFSQLLYGAAVSLEITFFSLLIGVIGGTLLALLLLYGNIIFRVIGNAYVTVIRGTPMLVQMVTLFYILPYFGVVIPALISAIIAIGLNSIAYISQVVRAGIQSVGKGQIEAAQTLGFSRIQIIRLIILPQAFRAIFPALGNEFVTLIKDSSLGSVIGVAELTHQGAIVMSRTYDALTVYAGVAIIYLVMTSSTSLILYFLEKRLQYVKN